MIENMSYTLFENIFQHYYLLKIYKDNISILNSVLEIRILIYSDDITIFTKNLTLEKQEKVLQHSLLFIQWYSHYHGLFLNKDKTFLKILLEC